MNFRQYTAVFANSWQIGSHRCTQPRLWRFTLHQGEDIAAALKRLEIDTSTNYVLVGWPEQKGEDLANIKEGLV